MIEPSFTVGLLQMACVGNKQANLDKAASLVHEAAAGGAQVVCLQELFSSEEHSVRSARPAISTSERSGR